MALPIRRLTKTTTKLVPAAGTVVATSVPVSRIRREQITKETVRDPELLKQTLIGIQDEVEEIGRRTSPFDGGTILASEDGVTTGIPFVAGVPRVLLHRLNRRPEYVAVLSGWDAVPAFVRLDQSSDEDAVSIKLQFQTTCRVVLWVGP